MKLPSKSKKRPEMTYNKENTTWNNMSGKLELPLLLEK